MPDSNKQLNKLSKKRILEIMHDTLFSLEKHTNKNTVDDCLKKAMNTRRGTPVKTYKVVVTWIETGVVYIDGTDIGNAIKIAKKTIDDIQLPIGEYLDESLRVDVDTTILAEELVTIS